MDMLGIYIREALKDRNEIYLPGIGMFKREYRPAFFDDDKKSFIPPSQTLIFSAEARLDESLIHFVAQKDKITLAESSAKIDAAVSELKAILDKNEYVRLEGLGTLSKTGDSYEFVYSPPIVEEGFIEFDAVSEMETIESPADEPVTSSVPTQQAVEEEAADKNVTVELKETETTLRDPDPIPAVSVDSLAVEYEDEAPRRWLWPTIGAAICIIVGGIWLLRPDLIHNILDTGVIPENQEKIVRIEPINEIATTDLSSSAPVVDSLEERGIIIDSIGEDESLDAVEEEEDEFSAIVRKPTKRFEIIIASFKTMEEAKAYVETVNAKGYNAYVIKSNNPGNYNKISYASFDTEQEVQKALAKVRAEITKDAWTFENKNLKINN